METIVAAVVFGLIGIAVLGALVYILGMLLTGPLILADQIVRGFHDRDRARRVHHRHGMAIIH